MEIPLFPSLYWDYTKLHDGRNVYLTPLQKFVDFLKKYRVDSDVKALRKQVVWLEIRKYHDTCEELVASKKVILSAAVRYMCHHTDDFKACKDFMSNLQELILGLPVSLLQKGQTIFGLYKDIATNGLKVDVMEDVLLSQTDIPVSSTVYGQYECDFSQKEWMRILLFEWHFVKQFPNAGNYTVEKLMGCKYEYLTCIRSARSLSSAVKRDIKNAVAYNIQRRNCAERPNGIILDCGKGGKHLPSSVDASVIQCGIKDILRVVTINCGSGCKKQSGVHVYLELFSVTDEFTVITDLISETLKRNHCIRCCGIVVLEKDAWHQFEDEDGAINRWG